MKKLLFSCLICLLIAPLAVAASPADATETFPYAPTAKDDEATRIAETAALHAWLSSFEGPGAAAYDVTIPAAERTALGSVQPTNGPMQIGVHGDVSFEFNPAARTQAVGSSTFADGNRVWSGTFRSPGAAGVRLHLQDVNLPEGAALYVFGRHGHAFGPYTGQHKTLWTNTVAGSEIVLQVHLPLDQETAGGMFRVAELAHMGDNYRFGQTLGRAFCSWNDSCITNAECASIPSAIQPLQDAVAYLVFSKSGGSFICSGGLLNTTNSSGDPYLLTANHCFDSQSSAGSLEAYFQWTVNCGASCGSQYNPPGSVPRTNGSTLLATSATTDFTFVELSQAAPSGSVFLGWTTTAVANSSGTNLYRVSHPSGSPQAYSEQSVNTSAGTCGSLPRGNFIYSDATLADSEGGSSGSPVVNGSNQVVGQLFGACGASPSTTCDNDDRTVDGAFAVTYSSISQWLDPGSGGGGGGGGSCTGNNVWTGTASSSSNPVTPNCSASGSFTGELVCDSGAADLDLHLDKQSCGGWFGCSFSSVASSTSSGCDETVSGYNGSSGTYRWRVDHYSGPAESFTLCTNKC